MLQEHFCIFKTKQLISLLVKFLIDNMQVNRSGSSLCWLTWLLQNYGLLQFRVLKQKPCQCLVQVELNDFIYTCKSSKFMSVLGFHFMCWMSGVVQFNNWLISSWEENKCCYKLSKCIKWHLFHSKWLKLSFWVKIVVILSVAQLVRTVIFFSAWDKSRVKWGKSQNQTQM